MTPSKGIKLNGSQSDHKLRALKLKIQNGCFNTKAYLHQDKYGVAFFLVYIP